MRQLWKVLGVGPTLIGIVLVASGFAFLMVIIVCALADVIGG